VGDTESMHSVVLEALRSPTSHKMTAAAAELLALDAQFNDWVYEAKNSANQTEDRLLELLDIYETATDTMREAVSLLARNRDDSSFRHTVELVTKTLRDAMQG
jgi:hypothetical protein